MLSFVGGHVGVVEDALQVAVDTGGRCFELMGGIMGQLTASTVMKSKYY